MAAVELGAPLFFRLVDPSEDRLARCRRRRVVDDKVHGHHLTEGCVWHAFRVEAADRVLDLIFSLTAARHKTADSARGFDAPVQEDQEDGSALVALAMHLLSSRDRAVGTSGRVRQVQWRQAATWR